MRLQRQNSLDGSEQGPDYDTMRVRKDCRNTGIYCIVSLGLFIVAGVISTPAVAAAIPGGPVTVLVLGILIIITVILLCYWQRPRSTI